MTASASARDTAPEGFDLSTLVRVLMNYKLLIVAVTLLSVLGAIAIALTATPVFRAEAVVTDVRDQSMGALSSMASQLGGLASIAGVNLGSGDENRRESQAVLNSRRLAEEFIKHRNLLPLLSAEGAAPPSLWEGVRRFRGRILVIRDDPRKSITTVAIEWRDAQQAASWANEYVVLANDLLRKQAMEDAKRNIDYLSKQIAQTNVVEIQRVMYNLVEAETKKLMLANARAEYAFKVVDPAVAPEIRIKPQRTVIVMLGAVLGFLAGATLALAHHKLRRSRQS